ncbi:MAG: hypothetical protein J2P50_14365 [Hyphomicrobiaceae bacterium]|nr:hypothetical protein [Hyphomicrobiaceae bacterium]
MAETTQLVMGGRRMLVPRLLKRLVQVGLSVAVTSAVFFVMIAGNGYLVGRTTLRTGFNAWLVFIQRSDILATMVLTAIVTMLVMYWQRDQERRPGSGRPSM